MRPCQLSTGEPNRTVPWTVWAEGRAEATALTYSADSRATIGAIASTLPPRFQ